MFGWDLKIQTPTKGGGKKFNIKKSLTTICTVSTKGIWIMLVTSKEDMRILKGKKKWKLKKKNKNKGE